MSSTSNFWASFRNSNDDERNESAIKLAADTFESLSREEKACVSRDLHGIEEPIVETTDFVESKLKELDKEMALIKEGTKKYYTKALDMELKQVDKKEGYIGSAKFRLMFLRAELFNARLAARRLAAYFKYKYDLFGEERLPCGIRQEHLVQEAKMALNSGAVLYTGATDVAGRPVIIGRRAPTFSYSVTSLQCMIFYVFQKIIEDNEVAQRKGIVCMGYSMGASLPSPLVGRRHFPIISMVMHGLPVRVASFHIFYDDIREHWTMNLLLVVLPKHYRARFVAHFQSTHPECMCKALRYGIEPADLPITDEGDFQYDLISEYWDKQRQSEE